MDDVGWQAIPDARRGEAEDRLLDSLSKTRAFLFAIGQNVDNEHGARILDAWSSAGHRIGNHTYNHKSLSRATTPEDFENSILRAEEILSQHSGFRKWFRFPELKEGNTRAVRDRFRAFLALRGYRNGAVTIDASDWYYNQRLIKRMESEPGFDVSRYRQPYLDHIWDRAQYYELLAHQVLGHGVSNTLLIHYNLINALFLKDLLAMFQSRGWGIVDAEEAFVDRVFTRQPDIVPAGESLIWALAKQTGKFDASLRYPGEDDTYEKPILDRLGL
jgi:hypothetical protein